MVRGLQKDIEEEAKLRKAAEKKKREHNKAIAEAAARKQQSRALLRKKSAPGANAWTELSESGRRWARKVDVNYLQSVLIDRDGRGCDVSLALHQTGVLEGNFESSEVYGRCKLCGSRKFLRTLMQTTGMLASPSRCRGAQHLNSTLERAEKSDWKNMENSQCLLISPA
eukprot:2026490-Pleurochrysis_carterae.AAC.8